MKDSSRVMVLIPAYNEQANVAKVIAAAKAQLPTADVVVVNDGSADRTAQVAWDAGAHVLSHPFNMGYGTAIQTGYKYAHENGYDYVVQCDADGQHDPRYLQVLLDEVASNRCDVAIGSRFLKDNAVHYAISPTKRLGMKLFAAIASSVLRQPVTDPTSGFQGFNRRAIKFCASDVYPTDFADADVIIMLHLAGLRIKEVAVEMYASVNRQSRYLNMYSIFTPLYYIFKMALSISLHLLRKRRTALEVES